MGIFLTEDNSAFLLDSTGSKFLLVNPQSAPLISRNLFISQRGNLLRHVVFESSPRSIEAADAPARDALVTAGGVTARRPTGAITAVQKALRSGGQDVSNYYSPGSLRLVRKLGEPWTATYSLIFDTSQPSNLILTLENEQSLLLEDGTPVEIEGSDFGEPAILELDKISAPFQTYRDEVLAIGPALYWSMDSRDRDTLDDYAESGENLGVIDITKAETRQPPAVPYGGSLKLLADNAVTGPGFPAASASTFMFWIRLGGSGSANVITAGITVSVAGLALTAAGLTTVLTVGTWHHIALSLSSSAKTLYLDGALAASSTGSNTLSASASISLGGHASGIEIDELSISTNRALSSDEVSICFNARTGERLFLGVVKLSTRLGWVAANRAQIDVEAVGLAESFKQARAKPEFITDGSETVRALIQRLLDDELPQQPITADGVDVPELVAPLQENYGTVHAALTQLAELHGFHWYLHPMGEIVAYKTSNAPTYTLELDETVNLSPESQPVTTDARLFRSQQSVAAEGGRPETDTLIGDGSTRVFTLRYDADFRHGVTIEVDGVSQTVDSTGNFAFEANWAADDGTNSVLVPGHHPVPGEGAIILVRYRSKRTQVVSIADIDAIRKYGVRSNVVFDNTVNDYRRREALAAALLAGNAQPTRRIMAHTSLGKVWPPLPGKLFNLHAPKLYGASGGVGWLCSGVIAVESEGGRMRCILDLQLGPYQPFYEDYYEQALNLPAPE